MSSESVGDKLKKIRGDEPRPIFAERFGVHKNTLVRYEGGQGQPDAVFLRKLCEYYNINPTWLLMNEGPMYLSKGENMPITSEMCKKEQSEIVYLDQPVHIQHLLAGIDSDSSFQLIRQWLESVYKKDPTEMWDVIDAMRQNLPAFRDWWQKKRESSQ